MDTNVFTKTINNMVNQRLLDVHTNFFAKIISINFNMMNIQPLHMYKLYGEKAQTPAVLTNVPVLMPYKFVYQVEEETEELLQIVQRELQAGDTVFCGVAERDITGAKNGSMTTASTGRHHNLSDSVVIMGMSEIEYVESEGE